MSYSAKVLLILVASVVCMQCSSHKNEPCNTQLGNSGRCVPLERCPKMVALRETAKYPQQLNTLIANFGACGSDANTDPTNALICCESPADIATTPTAQPTTDKSTTIKPPRTTKTKSPKASTRAPVITTPSTTTTTAMSSNIRTVPTYPPFVYNIPCGKLPVYPLIWMELEDFDVHTWAVLLEMSAGKSRCVGSLLTELYVLTTAHCVRGVNKDDISMYFGVHNRSELEECLYDTSCQERKADKIIIHEEYDVDLKQNDIALIRVDHALTFTDFVRPICLPVNQTYDESLPASNVVSFAWRESFGGQPSETKRVVNMRVVQHDECVTLLKKTSPLPSHNMCTLGMNAGQDVCQGDSGAPLVWLHKKRMYVVGVVSHSPKCGMNKVVPGIAMRVTEFLGWILWNVKS